MIPWWVGNPKVFSPPRIRDLFSGKRYYCMIPWWGGGSKDFITFFQTALFLFPGKPFSGKWNYYVIPSVGRRFKGFFAVQIRPFIFRRYFKIRDYCMIPWLEAIQRILSPSFRRRYFFFPENPFQASLKDFPGKRKTELRPG